MTQHPRLRCVLFSPLPLSLLRKSKVSARASGLCSCLSSSVLPWLFSSLLRASWVAQSREQAFVPGTGSFVRRERGALWFGHCPWLWFPRSDALLSAKWGCCSPQGWGMCLLTDCKALGSGRKEAYGSTAAELPLPYSSKVELAPWALLGNKRARANKRSVSNLLFWGKC